jgi:phosphohistidine swiveling domain-containing protein
MKRHDGVIVRGISVSAGQVSGPVRIIKSAADVERVAEGDIMVVAHSSPAFAIGVMNAAGLICETGGVLTHICIVAKELGIPCLARVERATELLQEDMYITLDGAEGVVYG